MLLWRLSGVEFGQVFDGGYGLLHEGRWNSVGHALTYCATSPSLCVLEKLVHIEDPALMPPQVMVRYEVPDDLTVDTVELRSLPARWRHEETLTQQRGDRWHEAGATALLRVPSAIVPLPGAPDQNVLINHRHPDAARIGIVSVEPFELDIRLF